MPQVQSQQRVKKAFSLLELTENIKLQIEKTYRTSYWIKAEINKLNYYPQSGHCYPELVEKNSGRIVAEIRGFLFRNTYEEVDQNFRDQTGKPLADGMEVLLLCRVSYDPKYGLSLYISDIDPAYTLGEMARMRAEAIRKLREVGVFSLNKEKRLPKLVKRLAVISVETSKGWRDFTQTLSDSKYAEQIRCHLFPAKLQGDTAVYSIGKALKKIELVAEEFDAVAIIRGGGGETGMDCYDHFELAKTVATFPIPVLTGIGHSTNLTVVEMCGHKNLITPTALAHFLLDGYSDFEMRLNKAILSLKTVKRQTIPLLIGRLDSVSEKLSRNSLRLLEEAKFELRQTGRKLEYSTRKGLNEENNRLTFKLSAQLKRLTESSTQARKNQLTTLTQKIQSLAPRYGASEHQNLDHLAEKLRILDPQNVLNRGYSITLKNGKAIHTSAELNEGDEVTTRLAQGEFTSIIKTKKQ
jgi:exodeoxyribonuclease VII large subunit